jgi:ubiquinone biosynthesis accessory factor UbiK
MPGCSIRASAIDPFEISGLARSDPNRGTVAVQPVAARHDGGATSGGSVDSRACRERPVSGLARNAEFGYQERMNRNSDRPSIDELARKLAESVPAGLRSMREELEQNFRATLRSALDRLDLVTREEFEVQRLVLARTREKLDALAERLAALEAASPKKPKKPKKKVPPL